MLGGMLLVGPCISKGDKVPSDLMVVVTSRGEYAKQLSLRCSDSRRCTHLIKLRGFEARKNDDD